MYRLLIAEDDENIRTGLTQLIDWRDLGFEVVHSFADGEKAFAYLRQEEADVLLTDIRMPSLDGVSLTRALREAGNGMRIVFISGYRDFAYAKAAVDQDVEAYLLKPIKLDELYAVFSRLKQSLDMERNQMSVLSEKQQAYLVGGVLHELLADRFSTRLELADRLASLNLDDDLTPGFLLLFCPIHGGMTATEQQVLWESVEEPLLATPEFSGMKVCVLPKEALQVMLVSGSSMPKLAACHKFCEEQLPFALQHWIGQEYHLCAGQFMLDPLDLAAEFHGLQQKMQSMACLPQEGVPNHRGAEAIAQAARAYIDAAYVGPLTLQEVAARVRLSPAYFSRLFKASTGESYVQYLTNVRIEAAKALLRDPKAVIWRVAEAVGYHSPKHFSHIFRAIVGCTPGEYHDRPEGER